MELPIGANVSLSNGAKAIVKKQLGSGAQGIVYLVESEGRQLALKCYHPHPMEDDFYSNLEDEVAATPKPSAAFLWPLAVARYNGERCGYVMDLAPQDHHALDEFFFGSHGRPDVVFKSFSARLQAAIHICNAFLKLHQLGFSYLDVNPGGFLIRPDDGNVLICDNDNVCPNKRNITRIGGFPRYKAPEVIRGETPTKYSDRLSMAIVLYRIFMQDHPFEGSGMAKFPCMTEKAEMMYYGEGAVFVFDPNNSSNQFDSNLTPNQGNFWAECPPKLRTAFQNALSHNAIVTPTSRMSDNDWKDILLDVRRELIVYQINGKDEDYYHANIPRPTMARLDFSDGSNYIVTRHKNVYLGDSMSPVAYGVLYKNAEGKGEFGIENKSSMQWTLITASGKMKAINPGDRMPLRNGMQINFTSSMSAKVII